MMLGGRGGWSVWLRGCECDTMVGVGGVGVNTIKEGYATLFSSKQVRNTFFLFNPSNLVLPHRISFQTVALHSTSASANP